MINNNLSAIPSQDKFVDLFLQICYLVFLSSIGFVLLVENVHSFILSRSFLSGTILIWILFLSPVFLFLSGFIFLFKKEKYKIGIITLLIVAIYFFMPISVNRSVCEYPWCVPSIIDGEIMNETKTIESTMFKEVMNIASDLGAIQG